jgi:arylsulfatase A-like enzyme
MRSERVDWRRHRAKSGIVSGSSRGTQATRRSLLQSSLALGVSALAWRGAPAGAAQQGPATPTSARQPDIVIILTDDMRSTDWQALPQTRERLGSLGVQFPNFFTTTPACSPSRTSILTGLYAHEHQLFGDEKDRRADITGAATFERLGLAARTIAVALHDVGYRTALVGKFLNDFGLDREIPIGWDDWYSTSSKDYMDFELNENGHVVQYHGEDQYITDVLAAKAVELIADTPVEQPLFLYVAVKAPHGPAEPAPRHMAAFQDARVDDDPSVGEADMRDKPAFLRRRRIEDIDALNAEERRRLQSLLAVDEAVMRIADALEARGRLDHAYIFVLSDNGYAMGQHRWISKALPYDTITRVGMLAVGPGLGSGIVDQRLVVTEDLAPTIAEAAGASFPQASGRSLLGDDKRSIVLLENRTAEGRAYQALRNERWLYVEWGTGERELYDYQVDPYELENALADWKGLTPGPAALQLADMLHNRLAPLTTCSGAACRDADRAPVTT